MEQLHREEWLIGLSSWVIQDGNYVDFAVGERRRFAVGFFADDLHEGAPGLKHAKALGEGRYEMSGQVIVADDGLVMLDFGLLAYTDSRLPSAADGEWLAGRVSLEVDCYSYFEIHAKRPSVPPAVYGWTISGIWRQTAPVHSRRCQRSDVAEARFRPPRMGMAGPDGCVVRRRRACGVPASVQA